MYCLPTIILALFALEAFSSPVAQVPWGPLQPPQQWSGQPSPVQPFDIPGQIRNGLNIFESLILQGSRNPPFGPGQSPFIPGGGNPFAQPPGRAPFLVPGEQPLPLGPFGFGGPIGPPFGPLFPGLIPPLPFIPFPPNLLFPPLLPFPPFIPPLSSNQTLSNQTLPIDPFLNQTLVVDPFLNQTLPIPPASNQTVPVEVPVNQTLPVVPPAVPESPAAAGEDTAPQTNGEEPPDAQSADETHLNETNPDLQSGQ